MSDSNHRPSPGPLLWRQFLAGQSFGVLFAIVLFFIEAVWSGGTTRGHFGASTTTILAVYTAFGWVLGAGVGFCSGLVGLLWSKLRRADGSVPGAGPVLGFVFMALFIIRAESVQGLKQLPSTMMVSLVAAFLAWVGLAYLGRRFLLRFVADDRREFVRNTVAIIAFLAFVVPAGMTQLASSRLPERKANSEKSPNIVLVVVDALRPDHLSTYGYRRETSPNLEKFAENAVVFKNAYSHGNRTILAMPALFTSLYPSFHGAVGFHDLNVPLPEDRTTVAEVCRDAGYTTVGLMSNPYLKSSFGMTRGFDRVEEFDTGRFRLSIYRVLARMRIIEKPAHTTHAPDATTVTNAGTEWLHRINDRPFFLFVHYMDVHHPYDPPSEYESMFNSNGSEIDKSILFAKTAALVRRPPPIDLPRDELTRLIDLYDACIRYTDDEFGRLLDELESMHLDRETLVIFTSDHGDEFLENGSLYHTNLLIESLIRVPLVIGRIPPADGGASGRFYGGMARHVDVLPTIAEEVGGNLPGFGQGSSLAGILTGDSDWQAGYSIAEGDFCTSINKGSWKMMYVDTAGVYQLFKLDEDPLGLVDVRERYPMEAERLKTILDEYLQSAAQLQQGRGVELSEDALKRLRALGYIE